MENIFSPVLSKKLQSTIWTVAVVTKTSLGSTILDYSCSPGPKNLGEQI
jgi:hypothetical protein